MEKIQSRVDVFKMDGPDCSFHCFLFLLFVVFFKSAAAQAGGKKTGRHPLRNKEKVFVFAGSVVF